MANIQRIEFGWPLLKREDKFRELRAQQPESYHAEKFRGGVEKIPVYKVPIGFPKYRLRNGRTLTMQVDWLARNSGQPADFFERDPEIEVVQRAQHEILLEMGKGSELVKYFNDQANKQTRPLIIDAQGFVINGNRRLSYWRELHAKDPKKYEHLQNVEVAILPECSEEDKLRLEAVLQIAPDIKDEYKWHAEALMFRNLLKEFNNDEEKVAGIEGVQPQYMREQIAMLNEAEAILRYKGKENQWGIIDKLEAAFDLGPLVRAMAQEKDAGKKSLLRAAAFGIIEQKEVEGDKRILSQRSYKYIQQLPKVMPKLANALREQFATVPERSITRVEDNPLGVEPAGTTTLDIEIGKKSISDQKSRLRTGEIVVDVLESFWQAERDKQKEDAVLQNLQRAHRFVEAATLATAHATERKGVTKQIDAIRAALKKIETWATDK